MLNGRYGPYITDKQRNAKIPKDREPKIADAGGRALLRSGAGAPPRGGRFGKKAAPARTAAQKKPAEKNPAEKKPAKKAAAKKTGASPKSKTTKVAAPAIVKYRHSFRAGNSPTR